MQKQYHHGPVTWKVTPRNVWKDIANLANKTTPQFYKVAPPCMDDHQFKEGRKWISRRLMEEQFETHAGHTDETSWSRWTNISVRSCFLWGAQTWSNHSSQQVLSNRYLGREICLADRIIWSYDLESIGKKLPIGRQESRAIKQSLYTVSGWSPIQRWRTGNCWRIIKQFSNCPEMLAFIARIGRLDIVHGLHYLARVVIKWNKGRGKRLARISSHIHFTTGCRLGFISGCPLFRWSDLKDSEPPSGGMLCIFGSHTFVPHSCTEAEIISIDAGPRLEGINLWDIAIDVLGLPAEVIPCTTSNPEVGEISGDGQEVDRQCWLCRSKLQPMGVFVCFRS